MRSASAQLLLLAVWVQTSVASSAPVSSSVTLDVYSSESCVSEARLIAGVQERTPRVRFVARGGDRLMRVTFEQNRTGQVNGEMAILQEGELTVLRQIVATSCADAADAMALILAITLDPEAVEPIQEDPAVGGPLPPDSAQPHDTSTSTETTPAPASESTAPLVRPPPTTRSQEPAIQPQVYIAPLEDVKPPSELPSEPWSFAGLLGGEALFGPAPATMRGLRLQLLFATQRLEYWSPAILVGGVAAWSPITEALGGNAEFALQAFTLDVCPWRFGTLEVELRACASLLGGRFAATPSNTRNAAGTVERPFVSAGAVGSAHVRLSEYFEIAARIAALANVVRDEFTFAPRVFHTVAPVTLSFGLLVGFRIPD